MDKVHHQMAVPVDMNILIFQSPERLQGYVKSLRYHLDGEDPPLQDHISAEAYGNMEYHALDASQLSLFVTFRELVVFC